MIHPHTYIHPNAKLATNVKVDPFTVVHHNVEIGGRHLGREQRYYYGRREDWKELQDISWSSDRRQPPGS